MSPTALTDTQETPAQLAAACGHLDVCEALAAKGTALKSEAVRRIGPQYLPGTQVSSLSVHQPRSPIRHLLLAVSSIAPTDAEHDSLYT